VIAVSARGKGNRVAGTVGPALPGVEIKITAENEIICKGPNVMLGYYKDPEQTAEVIDKDGWFHTGDTGRFTPVRLPHHHGSSETHFQDILWQYINPFLTSKNSFANRPSLKTWWYWARTRSSLLPSSIQT
jgi:long-chain acyl-CoA synthetase